MDTTHPTDERALSRETSDARREASAPHESAVHFVAREVKLALRWVILICGIATALTMMTFIFWFWAIVPAIGMLAAFVLLVLANTIEKRTERPGDPHDETAEDQQRMQKESAGVKSDPDSARKARVEDAIERKSARTIAGIIVFAAVAALVIAGIMFGRELFILGGFILFAYMLLVSTPVWLGWLNDEAEEEEHRVESQYNHSGQ